MLMLLKWLRLTVIAVSVIACGGGGDDNSRASQDDVKAIASLGVLTTELTGLWHEFTVPLASGLLQGMSNDVGGSQSTATFSCVLNGRGSGTYQRSVFKMASRTGMIFGDSLQVSYSNCDLGGTGVLLNGNISISPQAVGPTANLNNSNYELVNFAASFSNFSVRVNNGSPLVFAGAIRPTVRFEGGNLVSMSYTTSTAGPYRVSSGGLVLEYSAGSSFAKTDVSATNAGTRKLDSSVNVITNSGTVPILVATPAALSGSTSSGRFVATSGTINTKSFGAFSASTTTTFNGATATVSGDTDGNGSMDIVFNTTWASLTQ
jgi:hypothetical protein